MKPLVWTIYAFIYVAIYLAQSSRDSAALQGVIGWTCPSRAMEDVVAPANWMQEGPKRGADGNHALAPATKDGKKGNAKKEKKGDLYE
eukprot:7285336-Pyramimonas_sp.AAC.1